MPRLASTDTIRYAYQRYQVRAAFGNTNTVYSYDPANRDTKRLKAGGETNQR
jgi:hypothetical protein